MTSADFHLGCDSLVRITAEDINGLFGYLFEWSEDPNYPDMKVGSCELAAEHDGGCEMFVDSTTATTTPARLYWLTWFGAGRTNRLCTVYEWLSAPTSCGHRQPERLPLHSASWTPWRPFIHVDGAHALNRTRCATRSVAATPAGLGHCWPPRWPDAALPKGGPHVTGCRS
jgi:hypothetical protein